MSRKPGANDNDASGLDVLDIAVEVIPIELDIESRSAVRKLREKTFRLWPPLVVIRRIE